MDNIKCYGRSIAVFYTMATFLIYQGMKRFIDTVFTKEEVLQADNLKEFSLTVSKSLNVTEILEALVDVVQKTIAVEKKYICIKNEKNDSFVMAHSTSALDKKLVSIRKNNPIVTLLSNDAGSVLMKDFKRNVAYKSMWEDEKKLIDPLHTKESGHKISHFLLFRHSRHKIIHRFSILHSIHKFILTARTEIAAFGCLIISFVYLT